MAVTPPPYPGTPEPATRNQLIDLVGDRHELSDVFGSGEEVVACRAFTRHRIVLSCRRE